MYIDCADSQQPWDSTIGIFSHKLINLLCKKTDIVWYYLRVM